VIFLFICSAFSLKIAEKSAMLTKMAQDDVTTRISALDAKLSSLMGQLTQVTGSTSKYDSNGVNLWNYMYKDSLIYQDVFNAYNSQIFTKKGSPSSWDDTSYASNPWNNRKIIRNGIGYQSNGNGMLVSVPAGYDVLWIRCLSDRWTVFRVMPDSGGNPEVYVCGLRALNEISPDGAAPDTMWNVHQWMPIPLRAAGSYWVYGEATGDNWFSGIAFGKNLWGHAKNSAKAYQLKVNGGDAVIWNSDNWNSDQLAMFTAGSNFEVRVPVVNNGKDKIVYIVEHNNNWTGTQHGKVTINDQEVERFRTSYNNPFAVHHNSKLYNRYMATRIPAGLIQAGDAFVRLRIDMTISNHHIHFREIGTHDYF